ncbi:MAG TPA: PAS domain S-box protein [Steroidobacteraceae bacterium]|nr:PAS domain S-box protein [Steroidobacteraceae bacterium]
MDAVRLDVSAAAAETEQVYRTLVEHVNDGIAVVQDARFVFANPSVAALGGRRAEDLVGLHIADVFHPADLPSALARYEARIRGEAVEDRYDIRICRPDGEIRWVGISVVATQWQGRPASLLVVTDITAPRRRRWHSGISGTRGKRALPLRLLASPAGDSAAAL